MATVLDTTGAAVEDTTGATVQDTAASGSPPPFAAPRSAAPRHPSARRGSARGSAGAPYVYVPVIVSLFTLPHRAVKGIPARRAGTGRGSAGAPYTFIPLVQETSGSTTGSTLTLTFPKATTAGNAVIIALCGYYGGSISGFTVGGAGVTFAKVATSGGYNCEIWAAYGVTESSATVVVTASAAGISAWAYEVAGQITLDQSAGTFAASGTSWSSGATPATIPYPHFVVGLGSVVGNSGTITPTASGWTNGTAYPDVAGASAVGGVSGYRLPPSSGTYTYSGTAASSSGWAAVTAAFLTVPPPGQVGTIWSGYGFNEHASYTGITATFTVPSLSGPDFNSVWVGMGGVYQVGIYQTYSAPAPGGQTSRPWSWWLPGAGEDWNAAAFPTAAGDSLTLTMQLTATDWLMTIVNHTENWSYTEVKSVLSVNIGSIHNNGAGPAQWIFPVTGVEIVIEREAVALPDYGTLTFTNIATTPPVSQPPYPMISADTQIDQYPGPYTVSGSGGSFAMHWVAES
jgi:hypothetical protein